MAKIGKSSRSLLRDKENAVFTQDIYAISEWPKPLILEFLHRNNINDRAVFFAENLQMKTAQEIEELKADLAARLEAVGASGIAELHLSGDGTSKSAHVHWWGVYTDEVAQTIEEFIADNRLSNKTHFEYTSEEFDKRLLKLKDGELIETTFEPGPEGIERIEKEFAGLEEFEERAAIEREEKKEKRSISSILDELLIEIDSYLEEPVEAAEEIRDKEIEELFDEIDEIEEGLVEIRRSEAIDAYLEELVEYY